MISEKNFAQGYTTFWEEHTPWLGDYYSSAASLGSRKVKSIDIPENSLHIYINNIIATTHFRNIKTDPSCDIEKSFKDSIPFLDAFSPKRRKEYVLTENYREIITIQAERIEGVYSGVLVHDPYFPGCGLLSNCRGDLLCGTSLVEIKANKERRGRRPFRPEDFRQLLVYCALNYLAGDLYDIQTIQLFNPRLGYIWDSDLEEFVYLISDSPSADLFEEIGNYLTELSDSIDLTALL